MSWSLTPSTASPSRASTAGRCGCWSRRCTATSRRSGSARSAWCRSSGAATGSSSATTRTGGSGAPTASSGRPRAAGPMPQADRLERFTPVERFAHRSTAALTLVLLATGLVLYLPSLSLLVGRRPVLEALHVVAGLLLPLPVLAALA